MPAETFYEGQELPPKDPNSGLPVLVRRAGKWVPKGAAGGGPAPGSAIARGLAASPDNAFLQDAEYVKQMARKRAEEDRLLRHDAKEAAKAGGENVSTALQVRQLLQGGKTPVGAASGLRIKAGQSILGDLAGGQIGIPSKTETANLEKMNRLGSIAVLRNASQMKGALSDKDVAFLKAQAYSAESTAGNNLDIAKAQEWMGARQKAFAAAQNAWDRQLGSPQARNARGQSFLEWWNPDDPNGWAAKNMPNPMIPQGSAKDQANAAIKAKSAKSTGKAVSLGPVRDLGPE